jgi:hypothetical protein
VFIPIATIAQIGSSNVTSRTFNLEVFCPLHPTSVLLLIPSPILLTQVSLANGTSFSFSMIARELEPGC